MHSIVRARLVRAAVVGTAALSLVVAATACSSSASPKAATSTLTIGDTAIGAGYTDIYVGIEDGIYKKHGLNVTLKQLNTSTQLVPALVGGSVQIGAGPADNIAAAIMGGVHMKLIALSEATYNVQMWGDPDIVSVKDLVGKKVAVTQPESESDVALTDLLKKNGLSENDVHRVNTSGIPAMISALYSRAVNAIVSQPPQITATAAKGYHLIADLSGMPFAVGTYVVTTKYAQDNSTVLQRFAEAEVEILKFLRSHPDETLKAIEKDSGISDPALAKQAYDFFLKVWTTDPTVQSPVIKSAFQRAATNAKKTAPSDVTQYIDNSYVQAALKSAS